MCNCTNKKKKAGIFNAQVISNVPVGGRFFKLGLALKNEAAEAFASAKAGQFLEITVENLSIPTCTPQHLKEAAARTPILRRPLSFADVKTTAAGVVVDLLYCVVGAGTVRLSSLQPGDCADIIGPLGNGFDLPDDCKTAVMVAGGIGCPPIEHLVKQLSATKADVKIAAFAGAKTAADLPFTSVQERLAQNEKPAEIQELTSQSAVSFIATDDGTAGFKGVVTGAVENWLDANDINPAQCVFFACGPEPMLEATAKLATKRGIRCMVSLERMMACGIGLCQSCAVEIMDDSGETSYKLCCVDGPVFDASKVVW